MTEQVFNITDDFRSVNFVDAFAEHFGVSKSSVRRDIDQGGLRIGGVKYPFYTAAYVDVKDQAVRLGKRRFLRFVLDSGDDEE